MAGNQTGTTVAVTISKFALNGGAAGVCLPACTRASCCWLVFSVPEAGDEACGEACDHGEEHEGDQRDEEAPPGPSARAAAAAPASHSQRLFPFLARNLGSWPAGVIPLRARGVSWFSSVG